MINKRYAVYENNDFQFYGTIEEIAKRLNLKVSMVEYFLSDNYNELMKDKLVRYYLYEVFE